jgi:prepilin-type processing-associated H-X9-DG protein
MKQLGLAMIQYSQDYDEKFPNLNGPAVRTTTPIVDAGGFQFYSGDNTYWGGWATRIYPYVKSTQVYRCPSNQFNAYGVSYGLPWNATNTANALIGYFERGGDGPALASFVQPAESLMIGEQGAGGGDQYVMAGEYYMVAQAHFDGANACYVDGHVKFQRVTQSNMPTPWPAANTGSPNYANHYPPAITANVF